MGDWLNKVFGPDRIRTLVSMATDTSHRVIMGKILQAIFMGSSVFLQVTMTAKKAWMGSKFGKTGRGSAE